ncbi:MAG: hypothetical protein WC796_03795 [Candidatus Pacearchaeota archaeon]|jgi:hypothetical protein
MKKIVLSKAECGDLVPHWPDLSKEKLVKLWGRNIRNSRHSFSPEKRVVVIDCFPILIDNTGFILNGKHRSVYCFSHWLDAGLEACIVENEKDVRYHIPKCCYGEMGVRGVLDAMEKKNPLVQYCHSIGVYTIKDLAGLVKQ